MTSLADFKNMTNEEKCYFMNARMKNKSKKTFKDEEVTFTFATAEKVLKTRFTRLRAFGVLLNRRLLSLRKRRKSRTNPNCRQRTLKTF